MKLIISTQVYENYAWKEDGSIGKGADAYWKAKGGDEYVIHNIETDVDATMAVMAVRGDIESMSDYFQEFVVHWELVDDNTLTDYEQDQLDFDGRIEFPAKVIQWAN